MLNRLLLSAVVAGTLVGSAHADVIFQGFGTYAANNAAPPGGGVAVPGTASGYLGNNGGVVNGFLDQNGYVSGAAATTAYNAWKTEVGTKFASEQGAYVPFDVLTRNQNTLQLQTANPVADITQKSSSASNIALGSNATTDHMTLLYGQSQTNGIRAQWSTYSNGHGINNASSVTATSKFYNLPYAWGTGPTNAPMELQGTFSSTAQVLNFDQPFSGVDDTTSSPFIGTSNGELISKFGFVVLSRTSAPVGGNTFTATATYSDLSTQVLSHTFTATSNADNTFYLFEAPTGKTLNSISFAETDNSGGSNYRIQFIDDMAFTTTVPEPGTLALLAFGSLAVMKFRRKRTTA